MSQHLVRDLDKVHRDILALSARVEEMIDKAGLALREKRFDLVDEVKDDDAFVDAQEVAIEDQCLKMLALHQPVAVDLRRIATVVKVNNDLERIADLAVSIAERARAAGDFTSFVIPEGADEMVVQTTWMVRTAMDAFVNLDTDSAQHVIKNDERVDELNSQLIAKLQDLMQQDSSLVIPALHCFSAVRHLERIADLSTNIAEDVIYLVNGEIVRHADRNSLPS